jgi:EmrB/QacA subfamily drug resistance transporter
VGSSANATNLPYAAARRERWLTFAATSLSALATVSILSMVNASMPTLVEYFRTDLVTIQWMVLGYSLAMAGLLLALGRLADVVGRRRGYLLGMVLYSVGCALCGLATRLPMLLLGRVVQATGSAAMVSNTLPMVVGVFPANERGQALGYNAIVTSVASLLAPTVTGILISTWGWRSVFLAQIPLVLAAMVLTIRFVPELAAEAGQQFDAAGAASFALAVVPLTAVLNQGSRLGWTSRPVLLLGAVGLASGAYFIRRSQRVPQPIIDLRLLRIRMFAMSNLCTFVSNLDWASLGFLLPFLLQRVLGYTPVQMGLLLMAQPAVQIVSGPVSGWMADRWGARVPATIGYVLQVGTLLWLSMTNQSTSVALVVLKLALSGVGYGLSSTPNSAAVLGSVSRESGGAANGFMGTMRHIGMVTGVAVIGTLFATRSAHHASVLGSTDVVAGYAGGFHDAIRVLACVDAAGIAFSWARGGQPRRSR